MNATYQSYDDLPLCMTADEVARALGLSRANAYKLMHARGFPTLRIGKRMVVPKDKLIAWIEEQVAS